MKKAIRYLRDMRYNIFQENSITDREYINIRLLTKPYWG